ncbi:hypothetical protein [Alienimonas californiensis]|uniref:LVIVD repeat protein n=1 Tax=Alienimonas californiensis TaxID=2527989 RepID=A0A517P5T4_9PLAN|nr:hypothetical protein [Alienimonas californiensis]QDT14740.1 hypothetical protein CA12_08180 [Alienimonas californiensis]
MTRLPVGRTRTARAVLPVLALTLLHLTAGIGLSQRPEPMSRIVWQDREAKTLMWGELVKVGRGVVLRTGGPIQGFPKLDVDRQELVQMARVGSVLVVGVRDDDGGKLGSGWVAVDLGVDEVPHGNHSDFTYRNPPRVVASVVDENQGNPAHVYVYDNAFFIANDARDGFTMLLPERLTGAAGGYAGTFHRGGGGHITLAAADRKVVYGTWIAGDGPDKGRVDVSDPTKTGDDSLAYTFHLSSGVLHGATANSGRAFFAPSDGVYWVDVDTELKQTSETVAANHISLGEVGENDSPLRTGAFVNHRNWVLFTTGPADAPKLCLLDAAAGTPSVVQLDVPTPDGLSLVVPEVVSALTGKQFAFLFQDRKEGEVEEKLTVVDLDPNGDRDFSDAAIAKTMGVGPSRVEGHFGHHAIDFCDDRRFGFLSNPGNGQIWIVSLADLQVIGKYRVGGMPTAVISVGGEESKH